MKKILLIVSVVLASSTLLTAGGLVFNTNQSTAWSRMLSRDASTDIDAVFYNPAGLTKLQDGWHFSINNQSLWQTRTINSTFPGLNDPDYEGKITAPFFPSVYAAYKTGNWAFSFGFNPVGGGGGATFARGLPSMEIPVSGAAMGFADYGVNGYSTDMSFEGQSIYYGIQAGVSYQIIDALSVYAGARYVIAQNTYEGYIKDNTFTTADGDIRADAFMTDLSNQAAEGAQMATNACNSMQPLVDGGLGDYTVDQAVQAGYLTETEGAVIKGGLVQFGIPPETVDAMSISQSQGTYYTVSTDLTTQSGQLAAGAVLMGDQEADVKQTGNGITPIIGANISLMEDKLNFGIKYEFKTKMDLTNETVEGKGFVTGFDPETGAPIEMFPDGAKTNADIPAMLSVGIGWQVLEPLTIQLGFHTYFDKGTEWSETTDDMGTVTSVIDKNFTEYSLGLEYNITDNFLLSAGYLRANTGVNENYQDALNYSLTSNTFGFGGAYAFNEKFKLQLGAFYSTYDAATYDKSYTVLENTVPYTETYDKNNFGISIGLDIAIGGNKE